MTIQQKTIKEIIQESAGHLCADQIFGQARLRLPSISLATVYRNLAQLTESGQIRRLPMIGLPDRFDKSIHPHEHLVCVNCGNLADIALPGLKEYLNQAAKFDILDYEISLKYICPLCAAKS